jgi:hypothetical protein
MIQIKYELLIYLSKMQLCLKITIGIMECGQQVGGIYLYNLNNARSSNFGDPITPSPVAEVNKQENKITFLIPLSVLETNDLTG